MTGLLWLSFVILIYWWSCYASTFRSLCPYALLTRFILQYCTLSVIEYRCMTKDLRAGSGILRYRDKKPTAFLSTSATSHKQALLGTYVLYLFGINSVCPQVQLPLAFM